MIFAVLFDVWIAADWVTILGVFNIKVYCVLVDISVQLNSAVLAFAKCQSVKCCKQYWISVVSYSELTQ